ncbi:MAG: serine protease [Patescibacteria group bacterium]|jgi:hypothetical protein
MNSFNDHKAVFALTRADGGNTSQGHFGTGFLVDSSGGFLTARHVFENESTEKLEDSSLLRAQFFRSNPLSDSPLLKINYNPHSELNLYLANFDICYGRVLGNLKPYGWLNLSDEIPLKIGSPIRAWHYGETSPYIRFEITPPTLRFESGYIRSLMDDEIFETSFEHYHRSSGAPIIDSKTDLVVGMIQGYTDLRTRLGNISVGKESELKAKIDGVTLPSGVQPNILVMVEIERSPSYQSRFIRGQLAKKIIEQSILDNVDDVFLQTQIPYKAPAEEVFDSTSNI